MGLSVLVAGGGIGGLAAALACARAGASVQVLEQAQAFAEVGAGVQLGPNVVRVLQSWGLDAALRAVAAFPAQLEVRDALGGHILGVLPLGTAMEQRYSAPYATVARADLQQLLLHALQPMDAVKCMLGCEVQAVSQDARSVRVDASRSDVAQRSTPQPLSSRLLQADMLVGADGLWSRVRHAVVDTDTAPRARGHWAYRAMVEQASLPSHLRSQVVTLWLGPEFHVVQYPVRSGAWLNVVAIVQSHAAFDAPGWDHRANVRDLQVRLQHAAPRVRALVHAVEDWRLWSLYERAPLRSAAQQARGRIALLGDAAHPMLPYLAQGAGMALEDAYVLGQIMEQRATPEEVPAALQFFAQQRWRRNARVQARALRNAKIFHWGGVSRFVRNAAMRVGGAHLLDMPWLYRG